MFYDGKAKWKPFITKFHSFCNRQGWNKGETKIDLLMWCLTDKARAYYTSLLERQPELSFRELENAMNLRFGQSDFPEQLVAEFMT